jgi:hypothetical protein
MEAAMLVDAQVLSDEDEKPQIEFNLAVEPVLAPLYVVRPANVEV